MRRCVCTGGSRGGGTGPWPPPKGLIFNITSMAEHGRKWKNSDVWPPPKLRPGSAYVRVLPVSVLNFVHVKTVKCLPFSDVDWYRNALEYILAYFFT